MEELRNLQSHHGTKLRLGHDDNSAPGSLHLTLGEIHHTATHYLVDEQIQNGLSLEQQYDDYRFATLSKRLEQQVLSLSELYTAFEMNAADDADLLLLTNRLLITLEQIVRLHSITRDRDRECLLNRDHFSSS